MAVAAANNEPSSRVRQTMGDNEAMNERKLSKYNKDHRGTAEQRMGTGAGKIRACPTVGRGNRVVVQVTDLFVDFLAQWHVHGSMYTSS